MTATPESTTPTRRRIVIDPPAAPAPPSGIHAAILAASVNFGSLEKDADNPYFKSKYLSLGALLNAVRPALTDQGIIITSSYELLPQGWVVATRLVHLPSGQDICSRFPVVDVTNSQKVGSSGTFGMRYNLLQMLGIAATDDDGNSASGLVPPDGFLGPVPTGQQRSEPQRLPAGDPFAPPPGIPQGGEWL